MSYHASLTGVVPLHFVVGAETCAAGVAAAVRCRGGGHIKAISCRRGCGHLVRGDRRRVGLGAASAILAFAWAIASRNSTQAGGRFKLERPDGASKRICLAEAIQRIGT